MTEDNSRSKAAKVALWAVTAVASLAMVAAGVSKFLAGPMWNGLFEEWGYSVAFKTLIGVVEVVGGLALLVPRLASYAGVLICAVMLGAIYTVWANQSELGFVANTLNLVLFALVAYARWGERWKPGS